MTDAEIFNKNVRKICKEKDLRYTKVDKQAGYYQGCAARVAERGAGVSTLHSKRYAKARGVKPERLTEGFYDN